MSWETESLHLKQVHWVSSYSEQGDPFHRFKGTGNSKPQKGKLSSPGEKLKNVVCGLIKRTI